MVQKVKLFTQIWPKISWFWAQKRISRVRQSSPNSKYELRTLPNPGLPTKTELQTHPNPPKIPNSEHTNWVWTNTIRNPANFFLQNLVMSSIFNVDYHGKNINRISSHLSVCLMINDFTCTKKKVNLTNVKFKHLSVQQNIGSKPNKFEFR